MTERQLRELLEKFAPAVRDAILSGIRDIRDNARLSEIVRMVEANDVDGALRALGYNPAVFNTYYITMMQAFEQGGLMLMAGMQRYTRDDAGVMNLVRFNVRDRRAEQWLQSRSSDLVADLTDDVRAAVRNTLADGMANGRNPTSVALDLVGRYNRTTNRREGGMVGLSDRDQKWSLNVRDELIRLDEKYFDRKMRDKRFDAIVRNAIASGKPLTQAQVTKLVSRYREIALKNRGDTIGRTEALAALNRSEWESTRQALEQSNLPLEAAQKEWDDAGDNDVRHTHAAMNGQRVGIDEPFVSPSGARLMHPHDRSLGAGGEEIIDCRCRVKYVIDFAYGVE